MFNYYEIFNKLLNKNKYLIKSAKNSIIVSKVKKINSRVLVINKTAAEFL